MNKTAKTFAKAAGLLSVAALPGLAAAGSGGTEFDAVWTLVIEWTQGSLGRVIAGSMILVGLVAGIANQSIMAFALGLGGGVGLYYCTDIISGVVGSALPII